MSKSYCVYEHVFPNGKRYIGITCDVEKRWRNGKGYETQGKIANAIRCYGWENVKHNIIIDGISKEQAEKLERYLIAELDTIVNGYNTTIGGENILQERDKCDDIYTETESINEPLADEQTEEN